MVNEDFTTMVMAKWSDVELTSSTSAKQPSILAGGRHVETTTMTRECGEKRGRRDSTSGFQVVLLGLTCRAQRDDVCRVD